jgi:formylglycine-generating enzyme required for sulfatase activity
MHSPSFSRVSLAIVCVVSVSSSVALADDVPTGKRSALTFVGAQAGEVRDDNCLKLKLVWIPPGKFTMGSPQDDQKHHYMYDESPAQVTLTKGFWLGQHEVTQAEWRRVMQTAPWWHFTIKPVRWNGKVVVKEGNDYPATFVSWNDAMKFCEKLTETERRAGRLAADSEYTLPTEAQWEYACRAGTTTRFSYGDNESKLGDYAWWGGGQFGDGNAKSEQYAHLVGQKKPNPWYLYDMHGNVYEWCRDRYEMLAGGTDPQGPSSGSLRVYKGGSWGSAAGGCRSAFRRGNDPGSPGYDLGFRLAAVASGK